MEDTAELVAVEQEEIQADLRSLFRGAVKLVLEEVLEEEVRALVGGAAGRAWAEPGRTTGTERISAAFSRRWGW